MTLVPAVLVGLRTTTAPCCYFGVCTHAGGGLSVPKHPDTSDWSHYYAAAYNVFVEPAGNDRYRLVIVANKLRDLGPFQADDGSDLPELTDDLYVKGLPPGALVLESEDWTLDYLIHHGLEEYERIEPKDSEANLWVLKPWDPPALPAKEKRLLALMRREYREKGYMYAGCIRVSRVERELGVTTVRAIDLLQSLVDFGYARRRACHAPAWELVPRERAALVEKHRLAKVWTQKAPYFHPTSPTAGEIGTLARELPNGQEWFKHITGKTWEGARDA